MSFLRQGVFLQKGSCKVHQNHGFANLPNAGWPAVALHVPGIEMTPWWTGLANGSVFAGVYPCILVWLAVAERAALFSRDLCSGVSEL